MNITAWINNEVNNGREATISLAVLENLFQAPAEISKLDLISYWAKNINIQLDCKSTIHLASDIITFYPRTKL
jgi:hypothetical protein